MVCTSTRPSPESPLAVPDAVDVAELQARCAALEKDNHKLKRINTALIERVESVHSRGDDAYAAFQHSVVLAEQVRERTDALNQAMAELKSSNQLLSDARMRAETAHQHLIDAIESISDGFVLFDCEKRIGLFNRRFKSFGAHSLARINAGTRLAEIKLLSKSTGLVVEEQRGKDGEHMLYRLRDGRWVQVSERPTREGGLVILYTDITEVKLNETLRREQAMAQKSRLLQRAVDNLSQGMAMVNAEGQLELWNHRFLDLCGLAPINAHRPFAEALSDSERWIRLITDHVPALIAYLTADLVYEFTNKVYEEWYCWPRGAMLGQSLRAVHSEEHCRRLEPYIERALSGESVTFEFAETNHSGQERYMLRSYVPNRQANGEVTGIFVLIRDITERRRTAEALHQAYQHLEQRVRERTAELTTVNQQLRREIDERTQMESRLREAKGEAEQANLSKTKFLAAVSHDLLQPLNAARLFTSALLEKGELAGQLTLLRNVSNSLEDVESLLGTLVDISKLDAGVIKPDIAPFAVSELLENLAAEYHQIAGSEGLRLDFIPSSALVRSDIQLLARILRNLLSNAIRYTREGRILLGCRRHRQSLSIEVWDTGVGIAEDKLGEIFQEFKRGDVSQRKQDRGLGLGLAIVDKIARMLGHRIRVSSQLGKGSMFAIEVPLTTRAQRPRVVQDAPDLLLERLSGSRIWVLDNDAAICAGMRTLLEASGCQVVTALSEEDRAPEVNNSHADADLPPPDPPLGDGHNGVDAVALINARRSTPLPALMITANYSNELKQQMRELGHTLMHKPGRPMKLKTAMSHFLERRG